MDLDTIKARLREFSEVEIPIFLTVQGKKGVERLKCFVTELCPNHVAVLEIPGHGPRRPRSVDYGAIQAI
jgi:hypothetical protein